jgi:chromosome segregation ATPase
MMHLQEFEASFRAELKPLHDKLAAAMALRTPQHIMEAFVADAKAAFEQAKEEMKAAVTAEISKLTQKISDLEAKVSSANEAQNASDEAYQAAAAELKEFTDSITTAEPASPLPAEASPSAADPSLSPPSPPSIGSSGSDLGAIAQ